MLFSEMLYWRDPLPRSGEENMAADQLLLETITDTPLLRCYSWKEATVSMGYFLALEETQKRFPDPSLHFVRRWTGGGIVDHRHDLTYTLVIPRMHPVARLRGAESYRQIHCALEAALRELGVGSRLSNGQSSNQDNLCFVNPVEHDLTGKSGEKLAGAGQRRSRHGLLHQGSVQADVSLDSLGTSLSKHLSNKTSHYVPDHDFDLRIKQLALARYASSDWLEKR